MALLIKSGRIITATDDYVADIYCEGETISRIEKLGAGGSGAGNGRGGGGGGIDASEVAKGTQTIDAKGKYVFPGFIDPHVHIYLPFMGTYAKDDYDSASRAALLGGTTTLIEMICPGPQDQPMDAFETWLSKAQGIAAVDYTFHMSVVRFEEEGTGIGGIRKQFKEIAERCPSFKIFMAYKGALDLPDEHLFALLSLAKEWGVITTAHCENPVAIDEMQRLLISQGKTEPRWQEPSRPTRVEAEGVHHLCTFAELTGAHVYCVHTSCEEAVRAALEARLRGVNVWIECVAPHLTLDRTYTETEDFSGAKYVMSPPLREKSNQAILWNCLRSREISTVGTDHAPFDYHGQKDMGKEAFTKIPNGIPSIQERVDLVHTYGVCAGRIDLHTMVDACSTQAARIFGMYPRKGTIAVGSDADLVVYDPNHTDTFTKKNSASRVDYNAFEGWERQGRAELVTVRGEIKVKDAKFVGKLGTGKLVPRVAGHF